MTRFAFVSAMDGVPWGGSEALWSEAASCLKSRQHAIDVNVFNWRQVVPEADALEKQGCSLTRRARPRRFSKYYDQLAYRWIDRVKPDLGVVSQGGHLDGCGWMHAFKSRGIPYVAIAQAVNEAFWPDDGLGAYCREAYQGARRCCFVSKANRHSTEWQIGTELSNASIVFNPYKADFDSPYVAPEPGREFRLAAVGRLHPASKGQDVLLDTLAMEKWRGRPLKATLYGKGPNADSIERMRREMRLENVTIAGHVDPRDIWRSNDALVMSSRYEGLPLSVVEAMMNGRPAIVTDVSGNKELLEDGVTGFVAAGCNVPSLDAALEAAWDRREEWQSMGRNAHAAIRKSVPRNPAQEFADLLSEVVSGSRS